MPRIVIGVAGGSCSGKSTFSSLLQERLCAEVNPSVSVLGMDRFYRREEGQGPRIVLSDGTEMLNFNDPSAINAPLLLAAIEAAGEEIVIVEGLFALAIPSVRDRLTLSVFIDYDADLRAIRRLLRDMSGGRGSRDPEFIARYFIESARVGHARFVEPSRTFAAEIVYGDSEGMHRGLNNLVAQLKHRPGDGGQSGPNPEPTPL